MERRHIEEKVFKVLMIAATLVILGSLFSVIVVILFKGVGALSISMITQIPRGGYYLGKEGGILNAIVGSLYLAAGATCAALLFSVPIAFSLQKEYLNPQVSNVVRLSLDVLWGVPSIIYGVFGFTIMLYLGLRASLLGGIVALTLLELPIMVRAMDEVLKMVPLELKEVSYTLGANRFETMFKVVSKQALPGMMSAVILAFGRGIGDAASILFTAGYTDYIPHSLFEPVASLPLAVFFQLGTPFPEVQERAYASALILLAMVLFLIVLSRLLTRRVTKYVVR
ncbi:MAG: phosphate ABC transporter permease PstA [Theionarchaea archaeon]|nr:MAG: phosphate ABC transporter permease [Theionarchaea archaeon DG-70]MBU7011251.1 phosphate ABC transporter permease PstA [Theionarchaea archaeon]